LRGCILSTGRKASQPAPQRDETMELNENQQQAATSTARNILCIAGPGSGKTRTLTERIRHLISAGTKPERIVAITFTTAAASEIEHRLKPNASLGYLGTLHGFMLRLLNQQNHATGFPPYTVMDEQMAQDVLAHCIDTVNYTGTDKELRAVLRTGPGEHLKAKHLSKAELVASQYFRHMRVTYALDFDRILQFGLELLRTRKLTLKFEHLLVDEFQDSGDLDAAIYRHLDIPNKFYVGDPRQSIYKFRGGNVRHIQALERDPAVEVLHLTDNYRCAVTICDAANDLLDASEIDYGRPTVSARPEHGSITASEFPNEQEEARTIARAIMMKDPEEWNHIAILVRTNTDVQRWEKQLGTSALPVRTPKAKTLPHDWSITRLFLSLLMNPENNALAERFVELTESVPAAKELASRAKLQMTTINKLKLNLPRNPDTARALGMLDGRVSTESRAYIHQISGTLTEGATLAELILALNQEEAREQEDGTGITITTIHKAKGREWNHVFLPGWNEHFFPKAREDEDIEEERRIAFVAITRAKNKLEISWSRQRTRTWAGPLDDCQPSRFIKEAGL
jgi:superfamily I DNA/RNA helicase